MEIRRLTGEIAYSDDKPTMRDTVEAAVSDGADLDGGITLIGSRPITQFGPIGSRSAYLVAYLTDQGVRVRAGCWTGTPDDFAARVVETHVDGVHAREYAAAIAMIRCHAELWTPAAVAAATTEASDE